MDGYVGECAVIGVGGRGNFEIVRTPYDRGNPIENVRNSTTRRDPLEVLNIRADFTGGS